MGETTSEQNKDKAIALTTARLDSFLQAARKDEDRLMRILEMRRLKRRLKAANIK
jgi:hypothetical protein